MGASDIAVLQFVFGFGLPALTLFLLLLVTGHIVNRLIMQITSAWLFRLEAVYGEVSQTQLQTLLKPLHAMRSQDWYLRNRGLIRILVINPKTGDILKYLPKNAHVVIVDRNAYVAEFLQSKIGRAKQEHLHVEDVFVEHAEDMGRVPAGSIDAVVAARVLCSSRSVTSVLAEIQRVLAVGGMYFFVEHTHNRHPYSILGLLQTILTKSKLWPAFTNNCHLNRVPEISIRRATNLERLHLAYVQLKVDKTKVGTWISRLFRLKPLYIFGHCTKTSNWSS